MAEGGHWPDERVPRGSGLYSQHSQVECENASVEVCVVMRLLGYGPEIRQARRDAYRELDRLLTEFGRGIMTCITTGSKAEGLTCFMERDMDNMRSPPSVMCIEDGVNSDILPIVTTVFRLSTQMCYHGHCFLFLERAGMMPSVVFDALCENKNGRPLLCSDLYVHLCRSRKLRQDDVHHERAGPSMPISISDVHMDIVHCLPCHCPSILQRWAERRRHWPSPTIVQQVVSLGAYASPVGYKGSAYNHVEWRICFNTGENELVSSLNNTQVYIYVILKMVVKDVLKPVTKEITSYTVKNIVLWLSENNPQERFNGGSLFYWIHEGLGELRTAIVTECLPYYMIPERNLMATCGLNREQKRIWVAIITEMMNEGQKLILRLPKIRQAIISHPESLMWYSKKRVELELLYLKLMNIEEIGVANESDPMLQAIMNRIDEIMREVRQRMNWEGSRMDNFEGLQNMMLM